MEGFNTCARAAGEKIIRWSGGSFQAEEGGEERVWECANGPVDHTCNASLLAERPRFFSAGSQPSVRQQPRLRHPPIWHGLAGPEHAALLVTTVRAALLPVHHGPRQGCCLHVRKCCALSRRRLATPSRESSAPPARPGEAGPSEAPARRRRAPYDLQGRPEGLPSRRNTDPPRRNKLRPRAGLVIY